MRTITAILTAKTGQEAAVRAALLKVAAHVEAEEPATVGFFVCQDVGDKRRFTTYERFSDAAAMDRHNNSEAVAEFFRNAAALLDGEVTLVIADEFSAK